MAGQLAQEMVEWMHRRDLAQVQAEEKRYREQLTRSARMSLGERFVNSYGYQRAREDGTFSSPVAPWPDGVASLENKELLNEREVRSGLRLRTYSDLSSFDIEGVPFVGPVAQPALVPSLCETIPTNAIEVYESSELSELILSGACNDGQPLPEIGVNFGPVANPVKIPRYGSAAPVAMSVLDEPGHVASVINARFSLGLPKGLEYDIVNGNSFWPGVLTMPTSSTGDSGHVIGLAKGGSQYRVDVIAQAVAAVQANGWYARPLQVVSSPATKEATLVERDGSARPLPVSDMLPDVDAWLVSPAVPVGMAVVAAWFDAIALFQHGGLTIGTSRVHMDYLQRGMAEMKIETRLLSWIRRPDAVAAVTGL